MENKIKDIDYIVKLLKHNAHRLNHRDLTQCLVLLSEYINEGRGLDVIVNEMLDLINQ